MELMIAWFLPLKYFVLAAITLLIIWSISKGFYKTALLIVVLELFVLNFIKIDGTNSAQANKVEINQRTAEYAAVRELAAIDKATAINISKKTFAEIMAEEELRSNLANKAIHDEIK